jgi:hypothetical protein
MGHGDSDGNFEDSTIETRLADIRSAVNFLKTTTGCTKIGLLGVRLGATLSVLTCAHGAAIDALILVSPIVNGKAYIEQCLRANLTTQMALHKKIIKDRKALVNDLMADHNVNVDGYLLTRALYEQISAIDLIADNVIPPRNVLLLQVSKRQNQPLEKKLSQLHSIYSESRSTAQLLIVQEDYFWTDVKVYNPYASNLDQTILCWLKNTYPSHQQQSHRQLC